MSERLFQRIIDLLLVAWAILMIATGIGVVGTGIIESPRAMGVTIICAGVFILSRLWLDWKGN